MQSESSIPGQDASLESSIATMQSRLAALGVHVEERCWLNPVDGIRSVRVRDRDCPLMLTNGKGATRLAALASALGEDEECYFGQPTPGLDLDGCDMHQRLLAGYARLRRSVQPA